VVLGTRSAVWAPLRRPGVIIVDEEHDPSYKQQDGFRYSARDSAVMRARNENIPVVLGSATPSMESLYNVRAGRFTQLRLPDRAGNAAHPEVQVVDMRGRPLTGALSEPLLNAVQQALDSGQQSLLFLNRRGFSPVIMCHGCGWIATCSRCEAPMTYHRQRESLLCHHCGGAAAPPRECPECGHGTQRIEETLTERFPGARVLRIDRDSTRRKGAMSDMVDRVNAGKADILVGTQMLAKGHDFPNLALVGIVDVDRGLFSTDFRATERMAQLFIQVSGRAGRSTQRGRVLIQTHFPTHPLLQSLIRTGYDGFADAVLEERRLAELPPYSYLALLRAEHYEADRPRLFLEQARDLLVKETSEVMVLGPVPAPMEKRAGRTRFQLLVQARRRPSLASALGPWVQQLDKLPGGKRVRWSLDVDPQDLL
jgi:primosomal protein N' (replication factor Y)